MPEACRASAQRCSSTIIARDLMAGRPRCCCCARVEAVFGAGRVSSTPGNARDSSTLTRALGGCSVRRGQLVCGS